jgi:hypothetical protein
MNRLTNYCIALLVLFFFSSYAFALDQDILIYRDGNKFVMKGKIDGKILGSFTKADECIQAAIATLKTGGEISLSRGEYPVSKQINLLSNVLVKGSGRGTLLSLLGTHDTGIGLMIRGADGVVVRDLSIAGNSRGKSGLVMDDAGDCKIENVYVSGFSEYGIVMRNRSFLCEISSCSASDNAKANYYFENLENKGRGGDYVPNLVNNSFAYGGGHGFETNRAIVLNIVGCAVFQAKGYGFYLHTTSNSVLISGCRTFQIEKDAVYVDNTAELNVSSNIFCWHRGHGIVMNNVQWATVTANNFIDSGVRTRDGSFTNGVVIENKSEGVQVTGNAIFNWGDQNPMENGITEDATCANNIIANNNINYYTKQGVVTKGKGTAVSNNISVGERSFKSMNKPRYPDFDTLRNETFIRKNALYKADKTGK